MKTQYTKILAAAGLFSAIASAEAVTVDLTTVGSQGTINGAIYKQIDPQSTGTGVIDSFVRLEVGGNVTVKSGYNTTVNGTLDNGAPDNFNHSITLSQVPVVNVGGLDYRQFLLDINENNNKANDQFLSLDEIQLFVGGTANSSVESFTAGILNHDGTLVYRMDAGADSLVGLNYALNSGSGSGDMFLYVPNSLFGGFGNGDVVTLYSQFGGAGDNPAGLPAGKYGQSDGFEEWAVLEPTPPTRLPDGGATAALLGLGLLGLAGIRRKS